MKKTVFFIVAAALLIGCGRSAFFDFTSSATYAKALPYTKRGEITDQFESRALISASYLNAIYPDDKKYAAQDTFLIGLYIANDFDKSKSGINNPFYKLTLNKQPYSKAELLDKNSELIKLMPLINRWSKYYIVAFDKNESFSKLTLELAYPEANQSAALAYEAIRS